MKLLTKEIKKKLPKLYSQEKVEDPIVQVKFFDPVGSFTWYAYEFDGEDLFFGKVYCLRLSFSVFKRVECGSFRSVAFAIPANIFFAFGKSFCTPA